MISHDVALDLAADRLDFALTAREDQELKEHLRSCDSCALYAQAVSEDDAFLEGQRWDNNDDDWREDDEYAPQPADADDDKPSDTAEVDMDREERGGGPSLDEEDDDEDDSTDIAQGSTQSDDDDDVGDGARDASTGDSDDPGAMGDDSEGDRDDDDARGTSGGASLDDEDADESGADDQASTVSGGQGGSDSGDDEDLMPSDVDDENEAAAQQELAGGDGQGSAAGGPPPEEDLDAAQAEAEADAMTDEELAGVDDQPVAVYFPECAADGVEAAAQKNGAKVDSDTNKRAEESVRAAEGTEDTDYGKVAVYRSIRGLTRRNDRYGYGYGYSPEVSSSAAAAIRNAILRSRTGHTGVDRRTSRGRLDSMSIHRVAMRDGRIFKRINAPAPGNYLVWVMVDCSSSMAGREIADAASVARALADASTGTPTVRLAVWGWSSPFLYNAAYGATAGVAKVWETGQPTSEVFKLTQLQMGGTPDATVLDWARRAIFKEARSDETPVIVLASDGFGDRHLPDVVAKAVKHGVVVKSVALGSGVHSDRQEATFGKRNYVEWRGSILETARPLATMIGRMASGL